MKTGFQLPTDTYQDFINRFYGNVRYLPFYMDLTGVHYDDFVSGITMERQLPEIILEEEKVFPVTFPNETERILVNKNSRQTLFDITLQNYGNIEKVITNLTDSKINNISLYREDLKYKKVDILKNSLTEYYKKNNITISTGTDLILLIPQGETIDNYGDFEDDYNNDFYI